LVNDNLWQVTVVEHNHVGKQMKM